MCHFISNSSRASIQELRWRNGRPCMYILCRNSLSRRNSSKRYTTPSSNTAPHDIDKVPKGSKPPRGECQNLGEKSSRRELLYFQCNPRTTSRLLPVINPPPFSHVFPPNSCSLPSCQCEACIINPGPTQRLRHRRPRKKKTPPCLAAQCANGSASHVMSCHSLVGFRSRKTNLVYPPVFSPDISSALFL